jgi:hypothetical protein
VKGKTMKLWTVTLVKKSGRGRAIRDTVEAEDAIAAVKAAEAASPGYIMIGIIEEETCE